MSRQGPGTILVICFLLSALGLLQLRNVSYEQQPSSSLEPRDFPSAWREFINVPATSWKCTDRDCVPVSDADFIFNGQMLDASPIVVESHKLIFFPTCRVGSSVWKKLFRRMAGYSDWKTARVNERTNGLRYLYHYTKERATELMNSPEYTRAIFVRDPKDRLLSSYLEENTNFIARSRPEKDFMRNVCCAKLPSEQLDNCIERAKGSLMDFVRLTQSVCPRNPRWLPQGTRIDGKFLPLVDFVGHMDNLQADAKRLLERIGAWEEFGKSGWGGALDAPIFAVQSDATSSAVDEDEDARGMRLAKYYTPELERKVEKLFASDYSTPQYNLTLRRVYDLNRTKPKRAFIDARLTRWSCTEHDCVPVNRTDVIYNGAIFDASPFVVESHKLIFFATCKVSSSNWKRLFRRMLGYPGWYEGDAHVVETTNGLNYLKHYTKERATEIMNSPEYTRAIFVRDPKERLVSSYLDKTSSKDPDFMRSYCCSKLPTKKEEANCLQRASNSLADFVNVTQAVCPNDPHWIPQGTRIDSKFMPLLNFVGHMDTLQADAKRLLEKIGAWEEFGQSGWGKRRNEMMFDSRHHTTSPKDEDMEEKWARLSKHFTPELEKIVEEIYNSDYSTPQYNLTKRRFFNE